jgi:hypothetical protein
MHSYAYNAGARVNGLQLALCVFPTPVFAQASGSIRMLRIINTPVFALGLRRIYTLRIT